MKKLFILIVIATISTGAFAEFGITGGATFSSLKMEDKTAGSTNLTTDSKIGFTLGVFTDVPLSTNLNFRPGLNYTQKGGKITDTYGGVTYKTKTTLNYLELPLDFIYKATGGFFVGAGPSLAYLLSGKDKYSDGTADYKLKIGNDKNKDDIKAFEFGGNLLAGYQLSNGIFFSVNYNLGFSDLSLQSDVSLKNRYFGIRVGKVLGATMNKNK